MIIPLLIIIVILFSGIINIIVSLVRVNKQEALLNVYINTVLTLLERVRKGEDFSKEAVYILSNTEEVAEIEDAYFYSKVYDLKGDITRMDTYAIERTCQTLTTESISWFSRLEKRGKAIRWHFANPFIWFYKGIELILYIVFGYFIKTVNPKYDFHSKRWKGFNTIFSIVSGIASIVAMILELKK